MNREQINEKSRMSQENAQHINVIEEEADAYTHEWNGTYYPTFPNNWTVSHAPGTGPEQCLNCAAFGCYQGQFIGYCANCAAHVYHGSRGRGFIDVCTELVTDDTVDWISVFDTYLNTVEFARFSNEDPVIVSDDDTDSDDSFDERDYDDEPGINIVGQGTVFEAHYEGGYADF
jgi:hypothetical protein